MQRTSIITAITVLAVGLVAFQFWNAQRPEPNEAGLPALARDLPKDEKAAERTFKDRIARRFAKGTPAAEVARQLSVQGFDLEAGSGPWRSAVLKRKVPPCEVVWRVRWRAETDKVAETDATYGLNCP